MLLEVTLTCLHAITTKKIIKKESIINTVCIEPQDSSVCLYQYFDTSKLAISTSIVITVHLLRSTNLAHQALQVMDSLWQWLSKQSVQSQMCGQQQVGFLRKKQQELLMVGSYSKTCTCIC